jgi:hypothetical protein
MLYSFVKNSASYFLVFFRFLYQECLCLYKTLDGMTWHFLSAPEEGYHWCEKQRLCGRINRIRAQEVEN